MINGQELETRDGLDLGCKFSGYQSNFRSVVLIDGT
jgi:hypothetical protein